VLAIKPLALDAPDDDPFGAGVVEDRDAAADFGAVWCGCHLSAPYCICVHLQALFAC
jgi:hypothetical protein